MTDFKKLTKFIGTTAAAITLVSTILGGWVMIKSIRYLSCTQKSMKKLEKAADVYLKDHAEKDEVEIQK